MKFSSFQNQFFYTKLSANFSDLWLVQDDSFAKLLVLLETAAVKNVPVFHRFPPYIKL